MPGPLSQAGQAGQPSSGLIPQRRVRPLRVRSRHVRSRHAPPCHARVIHARVLRASCRRAPPIPVRHRSRSNRSRAGGASRRMPHSGAADRGADRVWQSERSANGSGADAANMPWRYQQRASGTAGLRSANVSTVAQHTSRQGGSSELGGQAAARIRMLIGGVSGSKRPPGSIAENLIARRKAEGRGRLLCRGLPVYRTCCPPANGVGICETDADRASPCRHCWRRGPAFQGSGPTRLVWHLRRDAETGRMSVTLDSSRGTVVLQMKS